MLDSSRRISCQYLRDKPNSNTSLKGRNEVFPLTQPRTWEEGEEEVRLAQMNPLGQQRRKGASGESSTPSASLPSLRGSGRGGAERGRRERVASARDARRGESEESGFGLGGITSIFSSLSLFGDSGKQGPAVDSSRGSQRKGPATQKDGRGRGGGDVKNNAQSSRRGLSGGQGGAGRMKGVVPGQLPTQRTPAMATVSGAVDEPFVWDLPSVVSEVLKCPYGFVNMSEAVADDGCGGMGELRAWKISNKSIVQFAFSPLIQTATATSTSCSSRVSVPSPSASVRSMKTDGGKVEKEKNKEDELYLATVSARVRLCIVVVEVEVVEVVVVVVVAEVEVVPVVLPVVISPLLYERS